MDDFPHRGAAAGTVAGWLADTAAAAALLSVAPIPARWQRQAAWPRALRALPLAGAAVGMAGGLVLAVAAQPFGHAPVLAALLAVLACVAVSGALHEDGLADVADALGGRDRAQRLQIMRDPRSGSFAVLALVFAIGLQTVALAALLQHAGMATAAAALVAAHGASRLAAVWLMHALPAARKDGMSARSGRPDGSVLAQAAIAAGMVLLAVGPWLPVARLAAALAAGAVTALAMTWLVRRLLGGQTGDAAGATEVVVRTALLLGMAMRAGAAAT